MCFLFFIIDFMLNLISKIFFFIHKMKQNAKMDNMAPKKRKTAQKVQSEKNHQKYLERCIQCIQDIKTLVLSCIHNYIIRLCN